MKPDPESGKFVEEVWAVANKLRSKGKSPLGTLFKSAADDKSLLDVLAINVVSQILGEWFIPRPVLLFVKELLSRRKPKTILDPFARNGLLLAGAIEDTGSRGLGLIKDKIDYENARSWTRLASKAEWIIGDPLELLSNTTDTFEAVVGNLPFGTKRSSQEFYKDGISLEVNDEYARLLLLASALKLSSVGIGLYVVSNSFLFSTAEHSVHSALTKYGLHISGCFYLQPGSLQPMTSMSAYLIAVEYGSSDRVFVGELSEEPETAALLVNNFTENREGTQLSLGKFVEATEFKGYSFLDSQEQLQRIVKEFGAPGASLPDVATELNLLNSEESFPERSNALYLPTIGRSAAITDLGDATLKLHNYVQIVLREGLADARYVAGFFGTPLGLLVRKSLERGSTIPKVSKSSLDDAILYLPTRDIQTKTVAAASSLEGMATQIRELQTQLWSKPAELNETLSRIESFVRKESLSEWLDHLPFPLASILWTYHASGSDPKLRYEHLLHFFEGLAEFVATVLLSGFSSQPGFFENDRTKLSTALSEANLSLNYGSFGTWKTIVDYFGKRGRTLLAGSEEDIDLCKNLFSCRDTSILEMLFSKSLGGVIQETNSSRNLWTGHGGIVGQHTADERHVTLQANLAKVRDIFKSNWDSFDLVQPKSCRIRHGAFENQVERLMGPRVPFELAERMTSVPLETDALYLLPKDESRALRLIPFIKIMPSPRTAQNACYFYNRRQKDKRLRFVSYHFEHEAEVIDDFLDTLEAVRQLTG
jgi:hypothetical protein